MATEKQSRIKAIDTALDIVQYLHREGEADLNEVTDGVDVSKSTAHRHLSTLHERGYVVLENNEYSLGLQFLTHGGKRRNELAPTEVIQRKIRQLSKETSERAQFITEEHGERVYLYTSAGPNAVRTDAQIGKRGPLYVSAAGKAMLANLPVERREEIVAQSSNQITQNTIIEREALKEELAEIRDRGYAFNKEESMSGLRAVGAPVRFSSGHILGAISISGPANRFTGDYFRNELPSLLLGAVNEVELNLQYS